MLIQKYQPSWETDFNKIKKVINAALVDIEISIEHIGSTAIKNLAAKPIIDIDIIHSKAIPFEEVKNGLEKIGYYHNGDQGIKGREVFKRQNKEGKHLILDFIKHHLYVCEIGNEELQRHLNFRDYLNGNESERKAYEKIKFEIAEKANQDAKEYARLKEIMAKDFVESVLDRAK